MSGDMDVVVNNDGVFALLDSLHLHWHLKPIPKVGLRFR
jgi:hypothetical protein